MNMSHQPRTYRIGNDQLSREIGIDGATVRTVALHTERQGRVPITSREITLVLDAAHWRHDIPQWRWTKSGPDGQEQGFHRPDFDDAGWATMPHLHPIFDAIYDSYAWFRHQFVLPEEQRGQPITIVVGGMDDEDWTRYRVFLNGTQIGEHATTGRWREPCTITLVAGDKGHHLLSFGGQNLLAVEVKDLRRQRPDMVPGERDHYLFNSLLLDQFIAAGPPYAAIDDFEVTDVRSGGETPGTWLEVDVVSRAQPSLGVTLSYSGSADAPYLRKAVTIRNRGFEPLRLLDVTLEDWMGDFTPRRGGRGEPCLAGDLYFGIEHPAGVNMGEAGWLRAVQLPGRDIAPGTSFDSESVVVGIAAEGQSVEQAFQEYLINLRPRKDRRLAVYSALGWYDYTFLAAEALSALSEELVEENLRVLEGLREHGVSFDVYMLDDWWEPTDLGKFRERTFPHGGAALSARIRRAGMKPGLWFATTCAGWTCHQAPGMEAAIAGGTETGGIFGPPPAASSVEDAAEKPSWVDIFTSAHTRDKRFCLAAEPYQTMVCRAIPNHVRELGLACLKLDCATLHCTSSTHNHRPGKYSVEAMMNVVLATVEAAQQANPDLLVVWYWGFRAPWWLKYGDVAFDKGLKMEAASPASAPAPSYRQSVSLNVDQASTYAALLPLAVQDSLGVWLGNVAWANRMGKEDWCDAFLLDMARGSAIVQLWGDLGLLDEHDLAFLADVLRWMRANEGSFRNTTRVGGDPWRIQPYGYAQRTDGGEILTVYNPGFEVATLRVPMTGLGLEANEELSVYEVYPAPGAVPTMIASGPELDVSLRPFELRCLELHWGAALAADIPVQERSPAQASSRLDLSLSEVIQEHSPSPRERTHVLRGSAVLPTLRRGDHLALVARLHRAGDWWYHPEPQTLVQLTARLNGLDVYCEVTPKSRSYNGPGAPWVVYDVAAGPAWTGQQLHVDLRAQLPRDISVTLEAHLYDAWWMRYPKRFAAR